MKFRKHNETLDRFPDEYPKTDRNCLDCKHFKIKLKVDPVTSKILFKERNYARCKNGFILRQGHDTREAAPPKEPTYPISPTTWMNIKKGWRHSDWSVASVCEDFESIVDDEPSATE